MKKYKKIITTAAAVATVSFAAVGCGTQVRETTAEIKTEENMFTETSAEESAAAGEKDAEETAVEEKEDKNGMFTDRDYETDYTEDTVIKFEKDSVEINGYGAEGDEDSVKITKEGTYLFSGESDDMEITVDAEGAKIQLVLDNVSLKNDGAVINIKNAEKVFVTTSFGSENALVSTGTFTDTETDGAVYSKSDICLNGTGTLDITCSGGNGIVANDDFKATSGTYNIKAGKKGIDANDSVRIAGGSFCIDAGTDGIHVENEEDAEKGYFYVCGGVFDITAGSDAIDATGTVKFEGGEFMINAADDAVHSDTEMTVDSGEITVEKCYEGLEAVTVTINNGDIYIVSDDDGINANGTNSVLTVNGGVTEIVAKGDGTDSNGTMNVNGGTLLVSGPENGGNGSLDFEYEGVITGGTVIAAGSSEMAMNFSSDSTQPSLLCSFTSEHAAGEKITVSGSDGGVLYEYEPGLKYSCVVISLPEMEVGETYTITAGSETETIEMTDTIVGGTYGFGGGMQGGPGFIGGGGGRSGGQPGGMQDAGQGGMQPGGMQDAGQDGTQPEKPEDAGFGGMEPPAGNIDNTNEEEM